MDACDCCKTPTNFLYIAPSADGTWMLCKSCLQSEANDTYLEIFGVEERPLVPDPEQQYGEALDNYKNR